MEIQGFGTGAVSLIYPHRPQSLALGVFAIAWLGGTSQHLQLASSSSLSTLARRHEPQWHRSLRRRRQRARNRLLRVQSSAWGPGTKRRARGAWTILYKHHSFSSTELPIKAQRLGVMTWHCHTCKVNNPPKVAHCRSCMAHWSTVWFASKRSRSKSNKRKVKDLSEQDSKATEDNSWTIFPDKLPWVPSTPASRVNSRKAEVGAVVDKGMGLPPQPILPPPPGGDMVEPLTAEEDRLFSTSEVCNP